jgi:hypothetical protein
MKAPTWHARDELSLAFNIGDSDELATDMARGWWYWTVDRVKYFGPFRTRLGAERSRRLAIGAANG